MATVSGYTRNPEVARLLIEKGADVNAQDRDGRTVLMAALRSFELERLLVENGANVNAKDNDGWTVLKLAQHLLNMQPIDTREPIDKIEMRKIIEYLRSHGEE